MGEPKRISLEEFQRAYFSVPIQDLDSITEPLRKKIKTLEQVIESKNEENRLLVRALDKREYMSPFFEAETSEEFFKIEIK